ncbi:endonuclease [Caudoviricetes sp.]|nr:endonuclease [Caudoviricetes sp.]
MSKFERSYRDTIPVNGVVTIEFSNKTPLHRSRGMLAMECDHCGLPIMKHYVQAAKYASHFCGRACASAARRVRIKQTCCVCGSEYEVVPSDANRTVTCSRKCLKENRRRFMLNEAANMEKSSIFNYGNHEHYAKKLTESDIIKIRNDDRSQRAIAIEYGVGQSTISHIKAKTIWAHI